MENTVILVPRNGMGQAEGELPRTLAGKFFELLTINGQPPAVICFYTDGVKLACEGSPVIGQLQTLEQAGTRLILCSTCLNSFGLMQQIQVGLPGGMGDILDAMTKAEKVITI